jgi:hypothetical protein
VPSFFCLTTGESDIATQNKSNFLTLKLWTV